MTGKENQREQPSRLRLKAEEIISQDAHLVSEIAKTMMPETINEMSLEEIRQMIHELHVHQIELEMQNRELQRAYNELDSEKARYFDFYNLAPVGYLTLSDKGMILEANLTAATMLDLPRCALISQPLSRFIFREDQDIYYLYSRELLRYRDDQMSYDLRMVKDDGTLFWANLKATFIESGNGGDLICRIVMSDITVSKKAEADIIQAALDWQSTFDATNDAIWILDNDHRVIRANRISEIFFARPCQELIGKHCWEIVHETLEPIAECPFLKLEKSLHRETMELKIGEMWCQVTVDPILDLSGILIGAVHNISDISKRKQEEAERGKLEEQFHQAQKMESVGRLAGGVAHDFNNMLSVILGYTEIALEQIDQKQPLHESLTEIREAALRSADLVRQLLAFARKQTIAPQVLNLNETVEGMLKMLKRLIGEDIDLVWLPASSLWQVKIDPSQIDQILANLCVNANDAIDDVGKVTIETYNVTCDRAYCSNHAHALEGDYVVLSVSDDGCGMEKEIVAALFEPFFTTKELGKGTGLGLSTVYGIVKQNSGFVDVCSEPGRGTTIAVYLPRYLDGSRMDKENSAKPVASQGNETILLVEDEESILKMATIILKRSGYNVLAAAAPGEAIQMAMEYGREIHLIITDVIMPEMNGRDLAQRILAIYPKIRRLFMSGYTSDVIAHHSVLDEGMNFIQKPFSVNGLTAKVREVLDSHQ